MWVQSLGQEDPLGEGMAAHSRILAWRIPWTEEPDELQSMGVAKSRTQLKQLSMQDSIVYTHTHTHTPRIFFICSSVDGQLACFPCHVSCEY